MHSSSVLQQLSHAKVYRSHHETIYEAYSSQENEYLTAKGSGEILAAAFQESIDWDFSQRDNELLI